MDIDAQDIGVVVYRHALSVIISDGITVPGTRPPNPLSQAIELRSRISTLGCRLSMAVSSPRTKSHCAIVAN